MQTPISGFSKKTKEEKIAWLTQTYFQNAPEAIQTLKSYWNTNSELQKLHDDFIENTLSNYYLPFGVAPNFFVNGTLYAIPMVTEESSVVAAASKAAKFWLDRGGFFAEVLSTEKNGQIHINFFGDSSEISTFFSDVKSTLIESISTIEASMKKRGGGLKEIILKDETAKLEGYYQLHCTFETLDAMGANFINSCLETISKTFESEAQKSTKFTVEVPEIVMSILSNYTPNCIVRASVSCTINQLESKEMSGSVFAQKFVRGVAIANVERNRAVTHNKGIMNGIDAVIIATGNDFRAVEAGIHAYAAKDGMYRSLTSAKVENNIFTFSIEIPLALGTVGGLTTLHPLTKFAFNLLQNPNAKQLMKIVAVAGLAQNFAAIKSLVTTGIQQGHMKMHLMNMLNQLQATTVEKEKTILFFTDKTVTHSAVSGFIGKLRATV